MKIYTAIQGQLHVALTSAQSSYSNIKREYLSGHPSSTSDVSYRRTHNSAVCRILTILQSAHFRHLIGYATFYRKLILLPTLTYI